MSGANHTRSKIVFLAALVALGTLAMAGVLSLRPMPTSGAGNTLTTVDSTGSVGLATSIGVGTDGLPVISYWDGTNADLKVAHCGDAACSAGNTLTTVDSAGNVGSFSSIAVGTDGLPVISYWDGTNGFLRVAHCGNLPCSAGNTLTTVDSTGNVGGWASIAVGTDGLPVISYRDNSNTDLKVAHCGNLACSAGNTLTTVDAAGSVGAEISIAVGTDGLPVISYQDGTNANLKVAHCGNLACSAGNTLTTVDSAGLVGSYTSIAVGTDGLPVISYRDGTNANLKVAHCGDIACSAGNTLTTVDSAGSVGEWTSIAVGTDGLPVISYLEGGAIGDLKVAHCGNLACSASNTLTAVDSAGSVGFYTSIAVGTDGLPVISHYHSTNFDLKVAHCFDVKCTGAKPPTPTSTDTPTETPTQTSTDTPTNTATATATDTPTPTATRTSTPLGAVVIQGTATPTPPPPPPLGGVAAYPDVSSGNGGTLASIVAAAAAGLLVVGGAAWHARRRLRSR